MRASLDLKTIIDFLKNHFWLTLILYLLEIVFLTACHCNESVSHDFEVTFCR